MIFRVSICRVTRWVSLKSVARTVGVVFLMCAL